MAYVRALVRPGSARCSPVSVSWPWRRGADGRPGAATAGAGGRRGRDRRRGGRRAHRDHPADRGLRRRPPVRRLHVRAGSLPDHVWLGRPDRAFRGAAISVGRNYLPLVGDFNGNGQADILWYGPGRGPDVLWCGKTDGAFSGSAVNVAGTYEPLLGDFNGDGESDMFWYGPGAAKDVLWYGKASGGFSGRAVTVHGYYQPLVADFNGDGKRDILWYGPGGGYDVLWLGRATGGFSSRAVTIGRTYQPLLGDLNGDRSRDILWYGAGAAPDVLWFGHANGRFTAKAVDVAGTYSPFTGDFDGDGKRDIFWYGPGGGYDVTLVRRAPTATRGGHGHRPRHLPALCRGLRRGRPQRRLLVRPGRPRRLSLVRARQPRVHLQGDHPGHRLHPRCRAAPGLDDQPLRPLRLRGPRQRRHRRAPLHQQPRGLRPQLRPRLPGLRGRHGPPGRRDGPGRPRRPRGQLRPEQVVPRRDLGRPGRQEVPRPVHDHAQPGPGRPAPPASRRVLHPRPQVLAVRDLQDHPGPGARAESCASGSCRTSRTGPS